MSPATRSTSRPASHVPVIGALLGLIVLAAVVAFTLVLPDGPAEGAHSGGSADLTLPDDLPAGLIAVDTGQLNAELTAAVGGADAMAQQQVFAAEALEQQPGGAPSQVRVYGRDDGSALVQVVASAQSPGVFAPQGAPSDPDLQGFVRAAAELKQVDGATCSILWGAPIQQGQPAPDPTALPQGVDCQRGEEGRTFRIGGSGLSAEEAAAVLDALING